MDVRHQVFVSSTYVDLIEERREVIQALLELDCFPAGMEMFPAANEEQWELIKSVIDQSDYYIVIVGGRYGSMTAEGISYTEKEYDYAVSQGKPVAGFVHANPGDIPRSKSEIEATAIDKLEQFTAKVRGRLVKTYSDPASLGSVVSRSLVAMMKKHPQPGWVRGEFAMTTEVQAEISDLRAQLATRDLNTALGVGVPLDASLQHGEDILELKYTVGSASWSDERRFAGDLSLTWDEMLAYVGPLLVEEAAEVDVRKRLSQLILQHDAEELRGKKLSSPFATIDQVTWDAVIIQLRALGLIQSGTKKRPIADKSRYWRLTPAGDDYVVKLLAARRG